VVWGGGDDVRPANVEEGKCGGGKFGGPVEASGALRGVGREEGGGDVRWRGQEKTGGGWGKSGVMNECDAAMVW